MNKKYNIYIQQHSEDINSAAIEKSNNVVYPGNPQETPQTPQTPFGDSVTPTFSDKVLKQLPKFIKTSVSHIKKPRDMTKRSQYNGLLDMMILSVIGVCSCAFTKVRFLYRRDWYYPTCMFCIIALPGMGKGIMESIFNMIEPIRSWWVEKYKEEKKAYNQQQRELKYMSKEERQLFNEEILEKPSHYLFRTPTDSTYAAFIKALSTMQGVGAVLDTEIDTIVHSFAQEMGDWSVLIRKNFKHEHHEWYRKTDDEYGVISEPKFCMVISGTENQLKAFVDSIANGMFSRMPYYFYKTTPSWEDAEDENDCDEDDKSFFMKLGEEIFRIYLKLEALADNVRFCLTKTQLKKMNKFFGSLHTDYLALEGDEIHASIVRLAVIFQRIALILTMFRLIELDDEKLDKTLQSNLTCSDKDFNSSLIICQVLIQHIATYYEILQNREANDIDEGLVSAPADFGRQDLNEGFESLPLNKDLTRQEIIDTLTEHGVPFSTADKSITRLMKAFRLHKICRNKYRKLNDQEYLVLKKEADARKKCKKSKK